MTDSIHKIPNKELIFGKILGSGSFGIVYQGKWQGRDVAIKKLHMKILSPKKQIEFSKESDVMSRLKNPRVIHLFGICTEPGNYAMVMTLMPKGDLYAFLSNRTITLPWQKRWNLAIDIGKGLAYLHSRKVIHRDLKSPNILLDNNQQATITDFGLAKLRQDSKSIYSNNPKGSIPWMAPELFVRYHKVSEKSDVYAYGMVLWELASRKIPFSDAHNPRLISVWVGEGKREDIPKKCPQPYTQVIERCWKGKPEERPTAAMALEQLLTMQPKKQEAPLHNNKSSEPSKQNFSSIDSNLPLSKEIKTGFTFGSEQFQKGSDHNVTSYKEEDSVKPVQNMPTFDHWQCLKTLKGHSGTVSSLTVLPNGRVASGSNDKTIKIWDITSGKCLKTLKGHSGTVSSLTALPNGRFASGSWDKTIKVWDVKSDKCLKTIKRHANEVSALTSLPNGRVASGSNDGAIKIWDIISGKCLKTLKGHSHGVFALTALANDQLSSGSSDKIVKIWDVESGACLKTLKGHSNGLLAFTALPNGRIASGSYDNTIQIWDATSGKCLKTLKGHSGTVSSLTALPNRRFASGSWDKTVKIWGQR